ncbi:hypothetical protein L6164_003112 [Bauhinia variegata]|uniref:Uncharacterized protein n=1 Tax=Bauhinia variegata TaxID=167791 RepID=A0ACB9PZF9_BAUVA|nr:hypothetical protein L6164_003112 [Bauhinia variegata]
MEFVSLVVDKLLEHTLMPVAQQVGYVISYKKNIAELAERAQDLQLAREKVQHRIDAAKNNAEEIEGEVQKWLTDVDEIARKVKKVVEDEHLKNTGCSSTTLWWRHQLSRKAKKLAQEIDEKGNKQFDKVSYHGTESGASSTISAEAFESRVSAVNQIMDALVDPNLKKIGVYGLGGVGKTTLVYEVAKKAKEKSSDLEVVIITVKQMPEIKDLQQQIAERLQLKFEEQTLGARASRLRKRLEQEKNILLILDDLWEKLDLDEIGIPHEKENKHCKILMTSRNRDVLFNQMNTQKNFQLLVLTREEAWKLFKEKAVLSESSKTAESLSVARDIIEKCDGLPIAIVTIAAALKGKAEAEWRDVLRRLQNHLYPDINGPVEVSYKYLKDYRLETIFTVAGMITSSSTMDLFKYCCGFGLFEEMNKLKEMQDSFETCIRKLKDSCLLLDNNDSNSHFSMHDVVREAAISIASRDQQFFFKRRENLSEEECPKDDKLKSYKEIFLDFYHIKKIPERLDCPNLIFLHLNNKGSSLKLPDNFFERMPALKVLVLTKMYFEFLPSSIRLLNNLHTMCLHQCVLGDIEVVGDLKSLKVLSFIGSEIKCLPREIGQLAKLQLLDLSDCYMLRVIPPGVLLKLKMLEMLFIGGTRPFHQWAVGHQQSTASLDELEDLNHLNSLSMVVRNEKMLPTKSLFEKLQLQRYDLIIGESLYYSFPKLDDIRRALALNLKIGTNDSKHYFGGLLDHVEALHLGNFNGAKNIVPGINEKGLMELKYLQVSNNNELQFITDSMGQRDLFPNLESLNVYSSSLVKLCNNPLTEGSFSKLKVVRVCGCPKIKNLFSFNLPSSLPQLNEIEVNSCSLLERIVSNDGKVVGVLQFPELRSLYIEETGSLIGFYCEEIVASEVEQNKIQFADDKNQIALFSDNDKVIFSKLERLTLFWISKLNKIWNWQVQQFDGSSFHNLKYLTVSWCDGISKLLPLNLLKNLEELQVTGCESLEVIFDLEGIGKEEISSVVNSSHLRILTVHHLPKLKYLFPTFVAKALVKLQELTIEDCSELENVVGIIRKEEGDSISFVFPQVTKMELEGLPKFTRFYPGTYSTEWPQLREFYYRDVSKDWNFFGSGLLGFEELYCRDEHFSLPVQKSIPMLRVLQMDYNESMMRWLEQYSSKFCLKEAKVLKLRFVDAVSSTFPWLLIQRMSTVESLHIINGPFEEVFPIKRVANEETSCDNEIHIKALTLEEFPKLKYICREGNGLDQILKNLEELQVIRCSNLLNLGPSTTTFNNLTSLIVSYCNGIMHLMTSSTAKSLCQLTKMEITNCIMIEEIVAHDEITNNEVTFSKLRTLEFEDLPRLESFCSKDYIFNFPSLEDIMIYKCPEMKIFSKRVPSTPKLHNVKDHPWSTESYWEGDLNSTLQKMSMYKLRYLEISDYPELKDIWQSRVDEGKFQSLETLTISHCEWFSKAIQVKALEHLNSLKQLEVESCDSVEVVFDLEEATYRARDFVPCAELEKLILTSLSNLKHIWSKDPHKIFSFQNLVVINVSNCHCLKFIFPLSVTEDLMQLEELRIGNCNELETIVKREGEKIASKVVGTMDEEIIFNKLKITKLENLPCLESFCSENYVFTFPCLEIVVIVLCPKMKRFSEGVSNTPMLKNVETDKEDESCWEGNLNSTVLKLYHNRVAFGSDHPLPYVDTKVENTSQSELDTNKPVEEAESIKIELVGNGKAINFKLALGHAQEEEKSQAHLDFQSTDKGGNANIPNVDLLFEKEDKKSKREEERKEHEKMKVENMNMNVIRQSITICPESRDTDMHISMSQEYQTSGEAALELPSSVSINKGESVKRRAEETDHKDPTSEKQELAVSPLDIIKKVPKSEQVLIDQQHAHEENEASRKLQLLATNSQLSPVSYQSFGSGAEASGSFPLPSITDTTASSGPPLA